mgnify:CR=1 FL=1
MNQGDLCGLVIYGRLLEDRIAPTSPDASFPPPRYCKALEKPKPPTVPRNQEAEESTRTLRFIEKHPGVQMAELLAATGFKRHCVTGNIANMLRRGALRHEGERGQFKYFATGASRRKPGQRGPGKEWP